MKRYLAAVTEDFWYMLLARRPALYREVVEASSKPDFIKKQVIVTLSDRRAMISWRGFTAQAADADRQVDTKYGDGLVVDVVTGIKIETFLDYWGLRYTCEVAENGGQDDTAKA